MPHQFKDWLNPENKKLWKTTNHNLRFHDEMVILAHFKYLKPNIFEHFKKRIINGEDWADYGINGNRGKGKSQEYKEYAKYKVNSFYLEGKTKKFVNATDTYENTLGKLISFLNDYNRLKQKKIVVIVSEQRHGSTTLCQKINELPNTISLFEAFGNEGFFNDLTQTKHDLKLQMSKLVNGTSWLRGIDTISFKIFSDHGINLLDLVTLGLQMKVIFLRRNLRDSLLFIAESIKFRKLGN